MKKLIFLSFILLFVNCEEKTDIHPETFDININNIDRYTAEISWIMPEDNSNLLYDVILSEKTIASEISDNSFTLKNLKTGEVYSGKVIAKYLDGYRSIGEFSFTTRNTILNLKKEGFVLKEENISIKIPDSWMQNPYGWYTTIKWDKVFDENGKEVTYTIRQEGRTDQTIEKNSYDIVILERERENPVPITVIANIPNNVISSKIEIVAPSEEETEKVEFNITEKYIGYSTSFWGLENLNLENKNTVLLIKSGVEGALHEDYKSNILEVLTMPSFSSINYDLKIISKLNDSVSCIKKVTFFPKTVPVYLEDYIYVNVFNIGTNGFSVTAGDTYGDTYTHLWNLYVDDNLIGGDYQNYECYPGTWSKDFPRFNDIGLVPDTRYKIKVRNGKELGPADPIYEPNFDFTGNYEYKNYIEWEIHTLPEQPVGELDVYVRNITSEGFDLVWGTNIIHWSGCDGDPYANSHFAEMILKIDGLEYSKPNIHHGNVVKVRNLNSNTEYSVELILNSKSKFLEVETTN